MQGKVVFVNNYAKTKEDIRMVEGRTRGPSLLNVRIRWKWSASRSDRFTPWKSPSIATGPMGPQILGDSEEIKAFSTCWESNCDSESTLGGSATMLIGAA